MRKKCSPPREIVISSRSRGESYNQHFPLFSPCFYWFPKPAVISVPSANCFLLLLCLFQVQWLTHSSHVITFWRTSRRLVDCTVNETCREGGHFREIPLKRGYPHTKETLCIPFPSSLASLKHTRRPYGTVMSSHSFPLLFCLSFHPFIPCHATVAVHGFNPFQIFLLHYSSRCGLCRFYNLQANICLVTPSSHSHTWRDSARRRGSSGKKQSWSGREEEPVEGVDKYCICSLAAAYEYENAK